MPNLASAGSSNDSIVFSWWSAKSERANKSDYWKDNMSDVCAKAIFLSPFFYPEMISTGRYNTRLVMTMIARGVEVDVVTSYPMYPDWRPKYTQAIIDGAKIYRGGDVIGR